jgi:hypothetical protein
MIQQLWLAKAVSDVAVCQDVNRIRGIVCQFPAQLTDENTQICALISEAMTAKRCK